MSNWAQAGKRMKALAAEVLDVVVANSAGSGGRGRIWSFFVKHLHGHNLLELANECFDAMTEDQRRQFLARCEYKGQRQKPR